MTQTFCNLFTNLGELAIYCCLSSSQIMKTFTMFEKVFSLELPIQMVIRISIIELNEKETIRKRLKKGDKN